MLISGNDPARIEADSRQLVRQFAAAAGGGDLALEICGENDRRDAAGALADLLVALNTPAFLGGRKVIWLQDFSAFEDEATASQKRPPPVAAALARLADLIANDFPPDTTLVLNGPDVDPAKRLHAACAARGEVRLHRRPDISKKEGRDLVARLVREAADARQMRLDPATLEFLVELFGSDTGQIPMELEKLLVYAGPQPTLADATAICCGNREAGHFALDEAVGARDLAACYRAINGLLSGQKDPDGAVIGLVRRLGRRLQDLLNALVLLRYLKVRDPRELGNAIQRLSAAERERFTHNPLLNRHPFFLTHLAEHALHYDGAELQRGLALAVETDRQLVSTQLPPRLLLETLVLRLVRPAK